MKTYLPNMLVARMVPKILVVTETGAQIRAIKFSKEKSMWEHPSTKLFTNRKKVKITSENRMAIGSLRLKTRQDRTKNVVKVKL